MKLQILWLVLLSLSGVSAAADVHDSITIPDEIRRQLTAHIDSSGAVDSALTEVEEGLRDLLDERYEKAVQLYANELEDYAEILHSDSMQSADESLRRLSRMLLDESPQPKTEGYDSRVAGLQDLHVYLGLPEEFVSGLVREIRIFEAADYPVEKIQTYFDFVDRLGVDAPRGNDLRTWRFLVSQDIAQRLLDILSVFGSDFPAAIVSFADELEHLDTEAALHIRGMGNYLSQMIDRETAARDWLADHLSAADDEQTEEERGFTPDHVPVSVPELGAIMHGDPLFAVAVARFRSGFDYDSPEYRMLTHALRVSLECRWCGAKALPLSDIDTSSGPLISHEYVEEYIRRADGLVHALLEFTSEEGGSWRADPQSRADFMGNRLVQRELLQHPAEMAEEVMLDTLREWVDIARIPGAKSMLINAHELPEMILLVDEEIEIQDRLERTRSAWLHDTHAWSRDEAVPLPVQQWFALHGLVVLPLPYDDPLWNADPGIVAGHAAVQIGQAADDLLYHGAFSETFRYIMVTEAAMRMSGMWSVWLDSQLELALQSAPFHHPDAFVWYGILREYKSVIDSVLGDDRNPGENLPVVAHAPMQWEVLVQDRWRSDWAGIHARIVRVLQIIQGERE
ncbi:MAG: hypothetical protein ACOC0D_07220 [Spirochaeta sp.]